MSHHKLPVATEHAVLRLYKDDTLTTRTIAARVGVSLSSVTRIARKHGLEARRKTKPYAHASMDCGGLSEHRVAYGPMQRLLISQRWRGAW